ncbi:MAG: hypothetical protein LUQ07_02820 [Methanospirillum sp.]|nr:hypothetical protein [Methanospirillum sp.]
MKSSVQKRCPFDKKPCIQDECAVWSDASGICSFACIPDILKNEAASGGLAQKPPHKPDREEKSSGGFRVALFD